MEHVTEPSVEASLTGRTVARRYGIVALVGALVLLVTAALPYGDNQYQGTVAFVATIWTVAVGNALLVVALYGLHRRYGAQYGRVGLAVAALFGFAMLWATVATVVTALGNTFGFVDSIESIEGSAFFMTLVAQLLASVFGVVLWRKDVLGLGGIVMALTLPITVVIVVVLDALTGRVDPAFGVPLLIGWAAVGYVMLRDGESGSETVETTTD